MSFQIDFERKFIGVFCRFGNSISFREVAGHVLTIDFKAPLLEENYNGCHQYQNDFERIKDMQEDALSEARKANEILENCEGVTEEIKAQILQIMINPKLQKDMQDKAGEEAEMAKKP